MDTRAARSLASAVLATILVLSGIGPAYAAQQRHPGGRRLAALSLSRPLPAEQIQERLLPMGGTLSDYLDYNGNVRDVWAVPLHQSQDISLRLTVPRGMNMAVQVWNNDPYAEEPIASGSGDAGDTISVECGVPWNKTNWYYIEVIAGEGAGRYTLHYDFTDPSHVQDTQRIAGADRVNTAIEISKASFPATASTVVVATGWNFADALAASGLCGSYDAPLLLTRPTSLPSEVLTEIRRLQAKQVFVIGSDRAVSDAVFDDLQGDGREVERLEGIDRFETAAAIALRIRQHELAEGRPFTGSAFIVNGLDFPDALSVAPYAFSQKMPILPVLKGSVPQATRDALVSLGTNEAIFVGSESVVDKPVWDTLAVPAKVRVYGAGRTETAVEAAKLATLRGWGSWDHVGLATGWNFPDALGGGVSVGKNGGVLLLSNPLYLNSAPYKIIRATRGGEHRLFGGTRAISGCVMGDIDWAYYFGADYDDTPWVE